MAPSSLIVLALLALFSASAQAGVVALPPQIAEEILSESVPTVFFSPNSFEATDFEAYWAEPPPPGASLSLGAESLQWVRVAEVLLLPRGRLVVELDPSTADGGAL